MRRWSKGPSWLPPLLGAVCWLGRIVVGYSADDAAYFREAVEPVLRQHCFSCHSHEAGQMKGGLTLDSRSGWEQGGDGGPVIIPGDPNSSRLIQAVRRADPDFAMPPKTALNEDDVEKLVQWVRRGAPDPRRLESPGASNTWWAIKPLSRPAIPSASADHPIDAFVEQELAKRRQSWAPEADRRTLLRRLSIDLHGLLPTQEEVDIFQNDADADFFGRQIDALLASPRYGERWARHWLDVVHFAETHGHDQDRPRESAWPYRDYVIGALNSDKPFARFLQEQIAADALFPDEPALTPALGFLAAGPWDESSLRDIREDTLDREIGRYLDRDDIVANVMSTFASVTVHCARCHDHKFDPIPQRDYYALQAVFAGTEKAERLYDLDPELNRVRQRWMQLQVAVDRRDEEIVEGLLTTELKRDFESWADSMRSELAGWRSLELESFTSAEGTDLQREPDHILLASGKSPERETITLRARSPFPGLLLTGLRLELLTHESLPAQGPGRASNGNLHLTGLEVRQAAADTEPFERVTLTNAAADFEQEGWTVAHAIDDKAETGWGIHPQEGKPHVATFAFVPNVRLSSEGRIEVVLRQDHGRQHTLGRFRVAVTTNNATGRPTVLTPELARLLGSSPDSISNSNRFSLLARYLIERIATELARLPTPQRVYAGAHLFPPNANQKPVCRPRVVKVLRRGEIQKPIEDAEPGALSCVNGLPARFTSEANEANRRAALARWLSDPDNPLVWRSIVNRVWHYHFGSGLVDTPNDFGRMGTEPSSPELLDWLAVTFRDDLGGSLKKLHRLILTSRTWRQTGRNPQEDLLFRPVKRRLDAESFRDSLLRMNGRLDLTMGGPSVKQFVMSEGIHVTPLVDYAGYDVEASGNSRRAIYRFLFRTLPDPMMDALDSPPGDQSAPVRSESFTALQAFALLHHPFIVRQCAHLADSLECASPVRREQIYSLYQRAFQRAPEREESLDLEKYTDAFGLANTCRVILNSNEFHFIE